MSSIALELALKNGKTRRCFHWKNFAKESDGANKATGFHERHSSQDWVWNSRTWTSCGSVHPRLLLLHVSLGSRSSHSASSGLFLGALESLAASGSTCYRTNICEAQQTNTCQVTWMLSQKITGDTTTRCQRNRWTRPSVKQVSLEKKETPVLPFSTSQPRRKNERLRSATNQHLNITIIHWRRWDKMSKKTLDKAICQTSQPREERSSSTSLLDLTLTYQISLEERMKKLKHCRYIFLYYFKRKSYMKAINKTWWNSKSSLLVAGPFLLLLISAFFGPQMA
uniref:Uncharacterized protein n=1 Tax=Entomoneis paludosa TaxID=265537 RepID=A0A7S3DSU1_9STRA|mmetsp:Transcript_34544/g.71906  ORF Transcript_34544/g.71906 Transcript_34544/m.71906 type:complete len:282 (+) Transcript_34544:725-1570(+)